MLCLLLHLFVCVLLLLLLLLLLLSLLLPSCSDVDASLVRASARATDFHRPFPLRLSTSTRPPRHHLAAFSARHGRADLGAERRVARKGLSGWWCGVVCFAAAQTQLLTDSDRSRSCLRVRKHRAVAVSWSHGARTED